MTCRHLVVAYDVTDDRRRGRLAAFLRGYLERVQKSVFEGAVADRRMEALRQDLPRLIDGAQDSVRLYSLCRRCRGATEVFGTGVYVGEETGDVVV